jgi:hypothetical protein
VRRAALAGAALRAGVDADVALLLLLPGPVLGFCAAYAEWPLHRAACCARQARDRATSRL